MLQTHFLLYTKHSFFKSEIKFENLNNIIFKIFKICTRSKKEICVLKKNYPLLQSNHKNIYLLFV